MTARKMSLCCARCWLLSSSSTRGKTVQQPQQQEAVATFFFIRRSIRFRMMIIICYCSLWPAREPRSISFSELVKIRLRGVRHWQRGTCFWLCDHRFFFALSRIITSCSLIIRTEADGVYVYMRLYVCFDRLESARGLRSRRSWSRVTRFDGQFKIHRHKAIKAETLLMIFNSFSSLFD